MTGTQRSIDRGVEPKEEKIKSEDPKVQKEKLERKKKEILMR